MAIRQKVAKILSSDITKNSAKLLSANLLVQIIGLLVYPILTRLYSPEDFGLVNLFLSISGFIALFATAEIQYAIVLPKSDTRAVACFHVALMSTIITVIVLICTIPFSDSIAAIFNTPNLSDWYWAIPVFVLLSGIWTLLNYWYTRQKQFSDISMYQITQSVTNAGAKVGFGWFGFVNGGLILSAILSPFIALIVSFVKNLKSISKRLLYVQKDECKLALKEYSNFPKYSLPRALINYFSGNLPILLLTPFFDLAEIGLFGMALTLSYRPINMISSSLYQVLFQRTAEQVQNNESIMPFYIKFVQTILVIVLPLFIILYFILPDVAVILLGPIWGKTGLYIQIMLIWLFTSTLVAPICYLQDIFQKQKVGLFLEILLIVTRLIGLCVGIYYHNFTFAIIGYSFGSAIVIFIQLLWYYGLIKHYERLIVS